MAILIKQNLVMKDPWRKVDNLSGEPMDYPNFSILPIQAFSEPIQHPLPIKCLGAWFNAEVDQSQFQKHVLSLPVLNIVVDDYNDGRVFTLSRLIRARFNYAKELRISGNFLIEQMGIFKNCGVDSFSLPDDVDYDYALFILKNTPVPSI
tara:strand:- start:410 stop:859 length:450 start_codon:yes stop_codon:yes gene_type:complete